ncbi:hypothetical protein [Aquimarina sp. AU474]|uniref:hypothetical protein n=1 Tax=Aquimarina sp. AU474 TaxID=2108529 RepID=UPI000D689FA8|nr:hypothetical protein [Aquimarina sp. AU474]
MIKKDYKISLLKIVKFLIILLIVDFALGTISQYVFFNQKTGKYARATHAIEKTEAKVLIFGSSHAHRHYIPEVLEKELQTSSYNAGAEGQQLLYHSALQKMILKRTKPDVIILNVDEDFLYGSQAAYDRLSDLHPYYANHREDLKPILEQQSRFVDFKLFFKSYQTNSTLVHAIRYYLSPQIDFKGYRPLYGKLSASNKLKMVETDEIETVIDQNFVTGFKSFIAKAKDNNIKLVMVTSPNLVQVDHTNNKSLSMITEIIKNEQVTFIDFFNSKQFLNRYELFHDSSHLNNDGATLFSSLLAEEIKKMKL